MNLDSLTKERLYTKHIFIPLNWHGSTINPMEVTMKGNVIIAVGSEIAVFSNGLDFEEKVYL